MQLSESQRSVLLNLARQTIRRALGDEQNPPDTASIAANDPDLMQPGGCFVTLHELGTHRLRGCIGELDATHPIWIAVRDLSRAVLNDPRFANDPVTLEELHRLQIEIALISPLSLASDPLDFDLIEHGIYLTIEGRSGCFLPQVARESGWSRQQLLERLCTEKLDMPARAWLDPHAVLQRFTTTTIGPEPFKILLL